MGHGGRNRERGSEIEFLAPDAQAFAVSSADGFVDVGGDRPDQFDDDLIARSPLKTLATTAAVLALFAGGLVLAAPWKTESAEPTAAPETTTTTTTTTPAPAPVSTATEIRIDDVATALDTTGYLSTAPPAGFEIAGLSTSSAPLDSGWVELRATPGARRASGRWLAVQLIRGGNELEAPGARRVEVGSRGTGLYTRSADGVATLTFRVSPAIQGTLTGGGWREAELIEIADGMGHVGFRPVFAGTLVTDLELIGSMRTEMESLAEVYANGDARASLVYNRRADQRFIQIRVSHSDPFLDALAEFVLTESPDFRFSGPAVRIQINGRRLTAGTLPELDGALVARWVDGEETISVVSNLDMVDLLDVVATVEGATAESWRHAMTQAREFAPPTTQWKTTRVGEGELGDGSPWRVDIDSSGDMVVLLTDSRMVHEFLGPDDPPLHVFSTTRATVVIAVISSLDGAGQTLSVAAPRSTVDVPLQPVGAIGTPWVAVHVFDDQGPFTATVTDREGTVLESFHSDPDAAPSV